MRFYFKKTFTWVFFTCVLFLIGFNLYNRKLWIYNTSKQRPWGPSFREFGRSRADKLHNNIIISSQTQVGNASKQVLYQTAFTEPHVWPDSGYPGDDRIVAQLKFIPGPYQQQLKKHKKPKLKNILLYSGFGAARVGHGQETFIEQKCPVNACFLTDDRARSVDADAILFHHGAMNLGGLRPAYQVWAIYMLECPYHTPGLGGMNNLFNWTATYRRDSTIVAPYEKFVPFNSSQLVKPQNKNYAAGKTKKVAWFVSNCGAQNGRREYAHELSKYIPVDIYGACGPFKCPRYHADKCFGMLNKDYKFYLSFENSNCKDYITEKFFVNGLQNDVIPIVMGAAPEDYKQVSPLHSYIHVDDFESPKALADYLHKLDKDDKLYNEYFRWKGTGSFINTFFWCRFCTMLHDAEHHSTSYPDIDQWWRGYGVCIGQSSWRLRTHKQSV